MVVPVEVRSHWSPDVWDAPKSQLPKCAEIRGANRTAVYVVLWFGHESGHQATPCLRFGNRRPQSAHELTEMLDGCTVNVPYNLMPLVMDLPRRGEETPKNGFELNVRYEPANKRGNLTTDLAV